MDYVVKYIKTPYKNEYFVICSDGARYRFSADGYSGRSYLMFYSVPNDVLFRRFNINKSEIYYKTFKRREVGDSIWPYCNTKKECITLLKALIKETQIRYYADTEL